MSEIESLIAELHQNQGWDKRKQITRRIAQYGQEAVTPLIGVLQQFETPDDYFSEDSDFNLHAFAEDALVQIGTVAVDELLNLLDSTNWGAQHGAIYCLHHIGDERAISPLVQALATTTAEVVEIQEALESFGERAVDPLLEATHQPDDQLRQHAAFCLGFHHDNRIPVRLIQLAEKDRLQGVRISATIALGYFQTDAAREALARLVQDNDAEIAEIAQNILKDCEPGKHEANNP